MKNLYFAAPLFCDAEKKFNCELAEQLEAIGWNVFLPQRDGVENDKAPYDRMSKDERRLAMFELDRSAIFECDVFLFVLDGRVPDEGACVELGMAYTDRLIRKKSRRLFGLQTDSRAAFLGGKLNPMVKIPFDEIFGTQDALLERLKCI